MKCKYNLKEWYDEFIKLFKINEIKDTSLLAMKYDFNKLKALHEKNLEDITAIDIQKEINKIKYASTRQRTYTMLKGILQKAVDFEIIKKNVMKVIKKPKYKAKEKRALTHEEEQRFVNACKNDKFGDFFLVCLFQGLRRGETRALKVNDIDLVNNTLRVDESLNTHTKRKDTKNEQSKRIMPLFDRTKEILKPIIENKNENDLIFTIGIKTIPRALKRILKNANVRYITTHYLRHTFITRCQENNIPLYIVQSWIGHEKGSVVTLKIYTHINEETNKKYAKQLNESN